MKFYLKNQASRLVLAIMLGFSATTVSASGTVAADMKGGGNDFGGDCCADLEERVGELEATTVTKGNRRVSLKLSGFVNRAVLFWDNGNDSDVYSVGGADDYNSRFSMKGKAAIGSGWEAGFLLEWMVDDTTVNTVSENNAAGSNDPGVPVLRHETIYLNHKRLGTFSTGHSSQATDGVSEVDLSGADVVAYSLASDWVASFGTGTGVWGDYIDNADGIRADILLRYDSPNFKGFAVSASFGEDDYWDVAVRYAGELGNQLLLAGAVGYRQNSGDDVTGSDVDYIHGSVSLLHAPSGLNVTYATGLRETGDVDADFHYVKAGMFRRLSRLGKTAVYGEYGVYNDFGVDEVVGQPAAPQLVTGSKAQVWGLGLVQNIDAAAMEIYVGYRNYGLEIDGVANPDDIDAVFAGARIKF